jgi:hypothetical protein
VRGSPRQYPHNAAKQRQEAIDNAVYGVHQAVLAAERPHRSARHARQTVGSRSSTTHSDTSRSAALNFSKIVSNVGRHVELQPAACFLDAKGRTLPDVSDDWRITEAIDDRLKIKNVRTGHETVLAKDHIHHYTSNPHRMTNGQEHAFLTLLVQLYIQNDRVTVMPCLRPGEPLAPPPVPEIVDEWVDLLYPTFDIARKLGIDPSALAWARESRVATLTATGVAEVILVRETTGKLKRYRVRDYPEPQMLIRRLPPR